MGLGEKLINAINEAAGDIKIIAEDLAMLPLRSEEYLRRVDILNEVITNGRWK